MFGVILVISIKPKAIYMHIHVRAFINISGQWEMRSIILSVSIADGLDAGSERKTKINPKFFTSATDDWWRLMETGGEIGQGMWD